MVARLDLGRVKEAFFTVKESRMWPWDGAIRFLQNYCIVKWICVDIYVNRRVREDAQATRRASAYLVTDVLCDS